jgi:hypothetical protein
MRAEESELLKTTRRKNPFFQLELKDSMKELIRKNSGERCPSDRLFNLRK